MAVNGKMRKHCGILNLISSSLASKYLTLIYYALVFPVSYWHVVRGGAFTEYAATAITNVEVIDKNHIET